MVLRGLSSDVDVERLGGPPSKSFLFDIERGSNTRESSSRKLLGVSIVGQSVHSTSQCGETDYGTSELECIARKTANEQVRTNVCVVSAEAFLLYSRTETQAGYGTGRTNYYPSDSARTMWKDCFTGNPSTHIHRHQQTNGLSANQMI